MPDWFDAVVLKDRLSTFDASDPHYELEVCRDDGRSGEGHAFKE